jgi:hypothetical protein
VEEPLNRTDRMVPTPDINRVSDNSDTTGLKTPVKAVNIGATRGYLGTTIGKCQG